MTKKQIADEMEAIIREELDLMDKRRWLQDRLAYLKELLRKGDYSLKKGKIHPCGMVREDKCKYVYNRKDCEACEKSIE